MKFYNSSDQHFETDLNFSHDLLQKFKFLIILDLPLDKLIFQFRRGRETMY